MPVNSAIETKTLGFITSGSLTEGLEMRLDAAHAIEQVRAGKFVVVKGQEHDFFSMITDVRLDASNPAILRNPPRRFSLLDEVLAGDHTYATVSLQPMLMMPNSLQEFKREEHLRPVKSIPVHFSPVIEASKADVNKVFGEEEDKRKRFFNLGSPLDMDEVEVCLDLDRWIERSNGIFGKTGTGKTFLTRLVLAALIRNDKAVNLIFDMHSEYGWEARTEAGEKKGLFVKGLRNLFGNQVLICTLDPDSARKREVPYDLEIQIPLTEIEIEDIETLQEELHLHPTALETANILYNRYNRDWLIELINKKPVDIKDWAEELGANKESLAALYRKLQAIKNLPFVIHRESEKIPGATSQKASIQRLIDELQNGKHIDLEFGTVSGFLAYLLVANLITRRIHEKWVTFTERFLATKDETDRPKPLVITIEEAHKFLNPAAARQTIFGTIARELRKYFVSLLIVDQRPSGIDDEILSQIGTRITALLNDEKDIQAVFTGVSGASALRSVLASLDTKQQALILGHATPMPVVVKTRQYGEEFYRAMGWKSEDEKRKNLNQKMQYLPPDE